MRILIRLLLCYVIVWPAATQADAPRPLVLTDHLTAEDMIGHLQAYLDQDGTRTIETVRDAPFLTPATRGVDFGYTTGSVWLRLHLRNEVDGEAEWRLHFRENFLSAVEIYAVAADGTVTVVDKTGPTSTFGDRAVAYPEVTLPLTLPPGKQATVYVMYWSDGTTQTSFEIRSRSNFAAYAAVRTARDFIFYGMILFLAVAATLAFVITRQGVLAAYGAYAAAALLFMVHTDGNAFRYLWPAAPAFNNFASILIGASFIVTGANFARQFLQTSRLHPMLDRLLLGTILLVIGIVASTVVTETQMVKKILILLAFLGVLLFTASGLVAARTRFREVRFYVVAWTGAVVAAGIMTARHWLGIDIAEETQLDAMRIVMVVDAALMGLAILDRFNQLKQARQQALEFNLDQAQRSLDLSRRLQELEKQYALAAELADSRGRRLSDTAHDLRQPLHALRLSVQAMINAPETDGPGPEEIEKTFSYLEDLVASELHEPRGPTPPPRSTTTPAAEVTDIGDVLNGVHDMFAADAQDKGVDLRAVPTSLRTSVPPLALMRMTSNLVANAIKYTSAGRVLVGARPRGDRVRLEVHDTGPGMDTRAFHAALGRSIRLETADGAPGSGLGLAIVDQIATTHGLEIGLLTRNSPGTSIYVLLPGA